MSAWARPIIFGSATVDDSVKSMADFGFTDAQLSQFTRAVVTARTAGVMIRYDDAAENPSATVGHLLPINGTMTVDGYESISNLRFIRDASTNATVSITLDGSAPTEVEG